MSNDDCMKRILLLQGPLLNRLGEREPVLYGTITSDQLFARLQRFSAQLGVQLDSCQSDREADLIEWIAGAQKDYQAVIFNPGAFSHTSIALRDAVAMLSVPVLEVHVTNIAAREPFRQQSWISPVVEGIIVGLGVVGYELAIQAAVALMNRTEGLGVNRS